MKVLQVAAGLDEPAAGPSTSVRCLAASLQDAGARVEVHCVAGWRGEPLGGPGPIPHRHAQDATSVPVLKSMCLSNALHQALRAAAPDAAVIHAHGLWLMPNVYPAWVANEARRPLMLSPRGMLGGAALGFSRWRKQAFWRLLQGPAAATAACLHATGESEYAEIRAMGLTNPVAVIANGVDLPPASDGSPGAQRTLLTLGRIHPKKGLTNLIRAWAKVEAGHPQWSLRIIGPDEGGHAGELAAMVAQLGLRRVSIEPPLYGEAKARALDEAELFVLPTLNENFALTVAEALAAGLPVIATKGAPWAGLEDHDCGWWIDVGAEPLAQALERILPRPPAQLAAMGQAGRRWMSADFGWDKVAADMAMVYRWLAGENAAPDLVRFN